MAHNGQKIVIGVDGGGTKTNGCLMLEDGSVLAEGFYPSSNPHSNPEPEVRKTLHLLVNDLSEKAGIDKKTIDGICLGMAGCDRPADKAFIETIMRENISPSTKTLIVNDAVVAMVAVLKRLHGILLIAGTGSICLGYNERTGENARAGGWGHLLADEGSGYLMGIEALKAVLHEYDQRAPKTTLTKRILSTLKLENPTDLVGWTYMSGNGKTEVASLSLLVHEEADKGDEVSLKILDHQADELMAILTPVYNRLFNGEKTELALWGGNLMNSKIYRDLFIDKLNASPLQVEAVVKDERAMIGAARHMLNHL